jgi:hypothetical protein
MDEELLPIHGLRAEELLRQRRPMIGELGFRADHDDLAREAGSPHRLRRSRPCGASSDDDVTFAPHRGPFQS